MSAHELSIAQEICDPLTDLAQDGWILDTKRANDNVILRWLVHAALPEAAYRLCSVALRGEPAK